MQQVTDFVAESDALNAVLDGLDGDGWDRITGFKGWSVGDVIVHLHFWNQMVDLARTDAPAFAARARAVVAGIAAQGFRATENAAIAERGADLRAVWRDFYTRLGRDWADLDPKARVGWVGPDMSLRSAMTARQMETWAHGQAVFDLLGHDRTETDRIGNIVVLGVNTFGWSFRVHGLPVPDAMPVLHLTAPSGSVWRFSDAASAQGNSITGTAVDFARVVTQTRNIADTGLTVQGPVATEWMRIAQCFAGGPETAPAPGTRFRAGS
jgi:uncharacterized protein (TIGR03084 family)